MRQNEVTPIGYLSTRNVTHYFLFFFLLISLAVGTGVYAQDFDKQFAKAKEQFNKGNFSAAMDGFNPLVVYDKNNRYSEYAAYYYAVSAQRLGFAILAKSKLVTLRKTYPKWQHINEVNLCLGSIYFERSDLFQAMRILNEIKDRSLVSFSDSLKRFYLTKWDDVETLKMLREDYPNDMEVDRALARAIGKHDVSKFDSDLFELLLTKYNWSRDDFFTPQVAKSVKKDRYKVALLFPFQLAALRPTPEKKKNQPILDLYQGIRLAVDSLNKIEVGIDLFAYDTERNVEVTKSLLAQPELQGMDLIVGPLFAEEAKEVQLFSQKNEINLIANPVSNNIEFAQQNTFSFLYQPSHATLGREAAEMVASRPRKKTSMVYYGTTTRDSIVALNYIKRASELGVKVVYTARVKAANSADILVKLTKATELDDLKNAKDFKLKRDSIGSILVASDDPVIYTKVINSVESRGDSILVIGQESWLHDNAVDLGKFEDNGVILAAPNFCSPNSPTFLKFNAAYINKHGVIPSDSAIKGYEMMMNIGRAMQRYGTHFQDGLLNAGTFPGVLTAGYLLQPTRDNGLVPFVKFREGQLVPIK